MNSRCGYMLLWLAVFLSMFSTSVRAGDTLDEGKLRVLIITGGHGFEAKPFYAIFDAMADIAYTKATYPEAAKLLAPQLAKQYDVIVFYDMWVKGITPAQQSAFVELLKSGIGVVALHHTLAAHEDWPEYAKILGGKFHFKDRTVDGQRIAGSSYLHDQDIPVDVALPGHPITRGLTSFDIHDETYRHYDTAPDAKVLLTTQHPQNDRELAWVTTYGHSRVFYLQLGHGPQAYEHAAYHQLVARAVRWSAGRPADPQLPFTSLFNGKDLTGWKAKGGARWEVTDGVLIGRQGPNNQSGNLFTEKSFDDFELSATFQVVWPANTGIWYRYQSAKQAFQADILEYKKPFALTGSLYCTGKMFLAVNTDATLVNREGWNKLVIRAVGNRHQVFLNGKKVADVRDGTSDHGRIGFQVHAGSQFANMRVLIKQIGIRGI